MAALVQGCVAGPELDLAPGSRPEAARALLADLTARGPVFLETDAVAHGLEPTDAAAAAQRGIAALDVTFTTQPEEAAVRTPHLVLLFGGAGGSACLAPVIDPSLVTGTERLRAAFCKGDLPLAEVSAPIEAATPAALERLIWRATRRLFPDDYADTYGFDLLGNRIGLGGTASF